MLTFCDKIHYFHSICILFYPRDFIKVYQITEFSPRGGGLKRYWQNCVIENNAKVEKQMLSTVY